MYKRIAPAARHSTRTCRNFSRVLAPPPLLRKRRHTRSRVRTQFIHRPVTPPRTANIVITNVFPTFSFCRVSRAFVRDDVFNYDGLIKRHGSVYVECIVLSSRCGAVTRRRGVGGGGGERKTFVTRFFRDTH